MQLNSQLNKQNWQKLYRHLVIFILILLILIGLLYLVVKQMSNAEQTLQMQKNKLQQARSTLKASGLAQQTIIELLPQYQQLINRGFVGEEQRLSWTDALSKTRQQDKLFNMDYKIGPQEVYLPNFLPDLGNLILKRSVMTLDFLMLHEADMLSVFDGLQRYQTTLFMVRDWTVTRLSSQLELSSTLNALTPNLQTKCTLDWLTLRELTLRKPTLE